MATGDKKVNIYLKKFLPQQQITENFLDYLQKLILDAFAETWQSDGVFEPNITSQNLFSSDTPDTFDLYTPLRGTDGPGGNILNLDADDADNIAFENANSVTYYVGLRHQDIPVETEINVRTGKIKYTFFEEKIGEVGEPDSVVDDGDETLTVIVDNVFEAGVSHAGRKVKIWLKEAVSQVDAFEEVTVQWDGSNNYIETTTALGQTVGNVSTDAGDYQIFAIGPTVRRNTDLSLDPNILFLGTVEGAGAGNSPTTFDQSGAVDLSFGLAGLTDLFDVEHSLADGSHEDVTAETITTKQAISGIQFDTQVNASDEDSPDVPVTHTLFQSGSGSGLQNAKWVLRDSGGQIIAFVDAHGNAYFQNLAAVDSIFQSNLIVEGNTTLGDDINTDVITMNAVMQSLTDMIFVIDSDDDGTNSYKFYNHSQTAMNLLMELLDTGDLEVQRDVVAGRYLQATNDTLTGSGTEYQKNSDLSPISVDASLNEVFDETLNRKLLRVDPNNPADDAIIIAPSFIQLADGSAFRLPNGPILSDYNGGTIDFETGIVTGGGDNFTPVDFTGHDDEWFKYSLNLLQNNEVLVLTNDQSIGANFGATKDGTPNPPISEDAISFAVIAVQNDSGSGTTAINPITEDNIQRVPTGGSGSGGGTGNNLLQEFLNQLISSPFNLMSTVIFEEDGEDKTDSATASFNVVTNQYSFDTGDEWISISLLDQARFLDKLVDLDQIEVTVAYGSLGVDPAPIIEASPNGGTDYQSVPVERIGETEKYRGILDFDYSTVTLATLIEYALANADSNLPLDDGSNEKRSQEFTTQSTTDVYSEIEVYVNKLGSPLGFLTVEVVEDDSGSPSEDPSDVIFSSSPQKIENLAGGDNTITLSAIRKIPSPNTKLHLVFKTDDKYKSSFSTGVDEIRVRADSSTPTIADSQSFNGTAWAAVTDTALVHKLSGITLDLKLRVEASQDDVFLDGLAAYYKKDAQPISQESVPIQRERISPQAGVVTIPVTQFVPNDFTVVVYDLNVGSAYRPNANTFSIDGSNIVFANKFFEDRPDDPIELEIYGIQSGDLSKAGGDFSTLLQLAVANFLGSDDSSIDKSQDGRGPKIRNSAGTLRELTLDDEDNIVIKAVP